MNALRDFILMLCRVAIAVLFLFAAYQKLFAPESGPQKFAMSIHSFKILPDHLVHLAAAALPWLEVFCGLLLLAGIWTRAAAWLFVAMIVVFTGAVISVLVRHLPASCGCFGKFSLLCPHDVLTWCKVGENSLILLPTLAVAIFGGGWLDFDRRARISAPQGSPAGVGPAPATSPSRA